MRTLTKHPAGIDLTHSAFALLDTAGRTITTGPLFATPGAGQDGDIYAFASRATGRRLEIGVAKRIGSGVNRYAPLLAVAAPSSCIGDRSSRIQTPRPSDRRRPYWSSRVVAGRRRSVSFFNSVVQFVTMVSDSGGASAVGSMTMNRWPSAVTTY